METIESLIPDNEGNHLVVVLSFYDNIEKSDTFQIPPEFLNLDIADISITKLMLDAPLRLSAFNKMCDWLIEQFMIFPNSVFTFICSTDPLATNHQEISSELYRWSLFEYFYRHNISRLENLGIQSTDIIVGPEGYQTFARVFYRMKDAPVMHIVIDHLTNKYR